MGGILSDSTIHVLLYNLNHTSSDGLPFDSDTTRDVGCIE